MYDEDTGEIQEQALQELEKVTDDVKTKGLAVACYIKNLEAESKAVEEAKKAMALREQRLNKRVDYLTDYLRYNMEKCGIKEITCPYFKARLQKCQPAVDVTEETEIPEEFFNIKQTRALDKMKVKQAIMGGATIPGVTLKFNNTLIIR
jgi:hypothetical protein